MRDSFIEALTSTERNPLVIPEEYDWFAPLIGDWDIEWVTKFGQREPEHIQGEWLFSRVLNGTAIQDIFICPSREIRQQTQKLGAEYGTTIRVFNPDQKIWESFYGCTGQATRLHTRKEGDKIISTEITQERMQWVFSEITEDTFHWQRQVLFNGLQWTVWGEVFATRRK